MGMDRGCGNKYLDFVPAEGASLLCPMQEPVSSLDMDAGDQRVGTSTVTLTHQAASPTETERIVSRRKESAYQRKSTSRRHSRTTGRNTVNSGSWTLPG